MDTTDFARENAALRYEIHRLRCQARRDTDAINEAEENARVYRRLAYRLAEKCNALERLLAVDREDNQCAPMDSPPTTGSGSTP